MVGEYYKSFAEGVCLELQGLKEKNKVLEEVLLAAVALLDARGDRVSTSRAMSALNAAVVKAKRSEVDL
jgi:hypothetical protein